ncbi:transglycosylase SLT domain-containing protein [Paragemmobacter ruber]|uniref:Transglycosylase SLT domain-containing protein n=1 Tax=Paragemmobacter ruber TaxID=1985673 RepID=A0ABW9Y4E1_9RHOB|nr:transglycosylase SLT domain-containing protein [Rhodobacter ruber]NBE07374.1 transglycosylase SLT domain-containing protein [Rhodobacter ruber]
MKQVASFLLLIMICSPVMARTECDLAAHHAAAETGVSVDLLMAITRTETQHRGASWPWTLNHQGEGYWFETKDQATTAAESVLSAGDHIDLGCFQINTRWHLNEFASVAAMLDPVENALYAARYLQSLHSETGDWDLAVAAYHSRDAVRGAAYLDRVRAAHKVLQHGDAPNDWAPATDPDQAPLRNRRNRFPLLLAGDPASPSTIVPTLSGRTPLVGSP